MALSKIPSAGTTDGTNLVLIKTKQGIKEIVAVSSSDDADYKETYLETYEE